MGLQTYDDLTLPNLAARITTVRARNVPEIAIWDAPVPQDWLPYLREFVGLA